MKKLRKRESNDFGTLQAYICMCPNCIACNQPHITDYQGFINNSKNAQVKNSAGM